uniref:Type III restriction enzyme n=1 Tax=Candidatus Kentrum sp. TUN TaxID=2126343 RepID=A0A451AJR3_9GAMM|nr:MAG: type III restriction enzyme [Candidatus Kentron sp. TUN]VFK66256.1 MAG: type III restriction enzyme [Candidatus Kentron sp. TUN]
MALHSDFPISPYTILEPTIRWFPADEILRDTTMDKLMPPFVPRLRREVKEFRDGGYVGATETSRSLLTWWFETPHWQPQYNGPDVEFRYFFAQREALETIIYLVDVVGVKDKFDLMRFDDSGALSTGMFDEDWRRFVIKMATGSGKTKVISLVLAWSFFHRLYESNSPLARNFLVIAPNIIVLDRLWRDFQGLRIFSADPVIPDNGVAGCNWRDDFQLTVHRQDELRLIRPTGNIFLTNIHRVYTGEDIPPSPDDDNTMDYFLGPRPKGATTDSRVDLGMIVRDIDELMVINDEAHHIHDRKLAWFKSIQDIHNRLLQKDGSLSMQLDVTATPRHNNGGIFVQTVVDYPLVEAISQNIVKHPVLPDKASREKLIERQSSQYTERYGDYIDLGVVEWRKAYEQHKKLGKKAILFVMTDDTTNCDDVAAYLETTYPDLKDAVLVIHTKNNGEITETAKGKKKEELEALRRLANNIDKPDNPYKAIVSVLVLKEGWDVRNVTTIVGLRAYSAKSNILPEQTLGRGLRKMYWNAGGDNEVEEYVSVVGTDAFMEFVESIQAEGVILEQQAMGEATPAKAPLVVEIDHDNGNKDIDALDIEIPVLTARLYREYGNLADLDPGAMLVEAGMKPLTYQQFNKEEQREIVFREITTGEIIHTTVLDSVEVMDYRNMLGYFARGLMKELRLVSGYDVLYGKLKTFVQRELFGESIDLESLNTLRNLSEPAVVRTLFETFRKAINALIVQDKGGAGIERTIELRKTRPFVAKDQGYLIPKKSVFNRIIGDSRFEIEFASFLDNCKDVVSYAKNYFAVGFKLDYVNEHGDLSHYYPDFLVKLTDGRVVVVETKGQEELDLPRKMERLRQWCEDINGAQPNVQYDFAYVNEEGFKKYRPRSFAGLIEGFGAYRK